MLSISGAQWVKIFIFSCMITGSVVALYYDDIFGEGMTSHTEVDWSSCERVDRLEDMASSYYMCQEPVKVWFAYRHDPYPSPWKVDARRRRIHTEHYLSSANQEFVRLSLSIDGMREVSQTFYDGERVEPWDGAHSVEFQRRHEVTDKVSAHGVRYLGLANDLASSFLCLSHTDSPQLCHHMADAFYANEMEERLAERL